LPSGVSSRRSIVTAALFNRMTLHGKVDIP